MFVFEFSVNKHLQNIFQKLEQISDHKFRAVGFSEQLAADVCVFCDLISM